MLTLTGNDWVLLLCSGLPTLSLNSCEVISPACVLYSLSPSYDPSPVNRGFYQTLSRWSFKFRYQFILLGPQAKVTQLSKEAGEKGGPDLERSPERRSNK